MNRWLTFFKAGSLLLILSGAVQLTTHFLIASGPQNNTERKLFDLMQHYELVAGGKILTIQGLLDGFSLSSAVMLMSLGLFNLLLLKRQDNSRAALHPFMVADILLIALLLVISVLYFPFPFILLNTITLMVFTAAAISRDS